MVKSRCILLILLFLLTFPIRLFSRDINWEDPEILIQSNTRFVNAASGGDTIALAWQEFVYQGNKAQTYLSLWTTQNTKEWIKNERFAGPFSFTDKETQIYSLSIDNEGNIYIAVSISEYKTSIFYSRDQGKTFVSTTITSTQTSLSPKIFTKENGDFYIFIVYEDTVSEALSIYYLLLNNTVFENKNYTGQFNRFVVETEEELGFNFLPSYCQFKNIEYVIFQARIKGEQSGYQLYMKMSNNEGQTWSKARLITDFNEIINGRERNYFEFDNQRPFITGIDDNLYITWERKHLLQSTQVYLAELKFSGEVLSHERITTTNYTSRAPQIYSFNGKIYILWFDSTGNDQIKIAEKTALKWEERNLSYTLPGDSRFPSPVRTKEFLYIFWENIYKNTSGLIILQPDQFVEIPRIYTTNFSPGKPGNKSTINVRWSTPKDSSGISSFYYAWSRKGYASLADMKEISKDITTMSLTADEDGTWYFHLKAGDYAGNYSSTTSVSYIRDTKPPGLITFNTLKTDENGFLLSNSFTVSWIPPGDDDVAGYSYELQYISSTLSLPVSDIPENKIKKPGSSIVLFQSEKTYRNIDNGIWAISVRAIDHVGNPGESVSFLFKLNKYIPVTIVTDIIPRKNSYDETTLEIKGRGFLAQGTINQIYLDKDGKEPYDYTFTLAQNEYKIVNDRTIDELQILDIEEDLYQLILNHQTRGRYVSRLKIKLEPSLTVKIGDFPPPYLPAWDKFTRPILSVSINEIFIWLLVILLGLLFVFSIKKITGVLKEGQMIEAEVYAIMSGKERKSKKIKKIAVLKTKGLGLRFKFSVLMTSLILLIILMLSITLSFYMIQTQRANLAAGLGQQVRVLMGSLVSGANTYLPLQDVQELGALPNQSEFMDEAVNVTITGINKRDSKFPSTFEYVWATNNEEIAASIDTDEYIIGESILTDDVSPLVPSLTEKINKRAIEEVSELAKEVKDLISEAITYLGKTDGASKQKLAEIDAARRVKSLIIDEKLRNISLDFEGSVPEFSPDNLGQMYTFYKPVVYRFQDEDIFFRGMVRVVVSTEKILTTIKTSTNELLVRIFIISLIAIGLGIAGAILLASITISPIKKLARGVALIRDTEDKSELKDHIISIKQKDEIRLLADIINQMTQGLVKAAAANKDLTVGKEVQKMFIPLVRDEDGKKGSTGSEKNDDVEFFGYYEGAKGVSGDYFDFVKLDNEHYAAIKCDVAGKGVPAALIMVEVATIFTDYFHEWTLKTPGIKIDKLVYKINDMIEERGFKGRFAALIIVIINVKTGITYYCNAGDNLIHIYSSQKNKMIQSKLPESPAAGVFPSSLIEMQTGFSQVKQILHKGDMLFLFSDGFDEAKRVFRDINANPVICNDPALEDNEMHNGTHMKGEGGEELGLTRLYSIIESVINKGSFQLIKSHSPIPDENLSFDFSTLSGTISDIIMALVSVEKIFRIYKHPGATSEDRILVDTKVDGFLQQHFLQYSEYFTRRIDLPENPGYVAFLNLNEDEQYDDLTILAVHKK
ncbi:MAG: SpoIIE family protein phosphatase [Spirochaetales bacterium]|nr:SpoIIE family protein phosphatase [Spirochaetales bacterium]